MKMLRKEDLKEIGKEAVKEVKKKAPSIMAWIGALGVVGTGVMAYRARPRVDDILEQRRKRLAALNEETGLTVEEIKKKEREITKDTVIGVTKELGPVFLIGGISAGCTLKSDQMHLRRFADISALYEISTNALKKHEKAALEVIGEKKEEKYREATAKEYMKDIDFREDRIFNTGTGNLIFVDPKTNYVFRASKNAVEEARLWVNERLFSDSRGCEEFVSLNDFYYNLHLPACEFGENNGFSATTGGLVIDYDYGGEPYNGEPAYILRYDICLRQHEW